MEAVQKKAQMTMHSNTLLPEIGVETAERMKFENSADTTTMKASAKPSRSLRLLKFWKYE